MYYWGRTGVKLSATAFGTPTVDAARQDNFTTVYRRIQLCNTPENSSSQLSSEALFSAKNAQPKIGYLAAGLQPDPLGGSSAPLQYFLIFQFNHWGETPRKVSRLYPHETFNVVKNHCNSRHSSESSKSRMPCFWDNTRAIG